MLEEHRGNHNDRFMVLFGHLSLSLIFNDNTKVYHFRCFSYEKMFLRIRFNIFETIDCVSSIRLIFILDGNRIFDNHKEKLIQNIIKKNI